MIKMDSEVNYSYLDENVEKIKEKISASAKRAERQENDVVLMSAVKSATAEEINYIHKSLGINDVGENRVQQLLERWDKLDKEGLRVHFIGSLQTNKVKYIIDKVYMIHSLDSEPRIVLASGILYVYVVIGNVDGTSEHQVFEQVGKTGMLRMFITCPHIVQHVDSYHLGVLELGMYDAEAVVEGMSVDGYHSSTVAFRMRMSFFGRSAGPVDLPSIFSTVFMPSITWPNTV